eukprot:jgi/Ulvmu1/5492/UM023_0028.1
MVPISKFGNQTSSELKDYCDVDPLSIPVWRNNSAPIAPRLDFSCTSLFPTAASDSTAAAHTSDTDNLFTASTTTLPLATQNAGSLERAKSHQPSYPQSQKYSTSSSQPSGDATTPVPQGSDQTEPRSFPLLTPPSETPLEAARTLLEATPVDPLAFGSVGRGGALFAPDMTPPASVAPFGGSDLPPAVASADTEAMYTPSADTPATATRSVVRSAAAGVTAAAHAVEQKSAPSHARSLSGLFRACVVDTFGLGSTTVVSSLSKVLSACLDKW